MKVRLPPRLALALALLSGCAGPTTPSTTPVASLAQPPTEAGAQTGREASNPAPRPADVAVLVSEALRAGEPSTLVDGLAGTVTIEIDSSLAPEPSEAVRQTELAGQVADGRLSAVRFVHDS